MTIICRLIMVISVFFLLFMFFPLIDTYPRLWENCETLDMSYDFANDTTIYPVQGSAAAKFEKIVMIQGMHGPVYVYANTYKTSEHIGTHMDAPQHIVRSIAIAKKVRTVDQVPFSSLIGEACVIDIPEEHKNNHDYLITVEDLKKWEAQYGQFHKDCIVIVRTGQERFWNDPKKYLGSDTPEHVDEKLGWPDTLHWPGLHYKTAEWLVAKNGLKAFGMDTISLDAGQGLQIYNVYNSIHTVILGSNRPGFENLRNVAKLPNRGATIVALPMKIRHGSGAPVRVLAYGWNGHNDPCRIQMGSGSVTINFSFILYFLYAYILCYFI